MIDEELAAATIELYRIEFDTKRRRAALRSMNERERVENEFWNSEAVQKRLEAKQAELVSDIELELEGAFSKKENQND